MAAVLACNSRSVLAQDAQPAAPPVSSNWLFNAEFDGYGSWNSNRPASGVNALRFFDTQADGFQLNAAALTAEYKGDKFGFHLEGGYGNVFSSLGALDPWRGVNQYIMQAYATYRPIEGNALQIDVGKFYTSVGAEVPDALSDFNYSRSLAFTLGEPDYHLGIRASIPVTKDFTAGVQLLDGVNDVSSRNHGRMLGLTSTLTKKKWAWNQVWITGTERSQNLPAYRNLVNEVLTVTPSASVEGYFELLYGHEGQSAIPSSRWYGAAISMRWHASKKLSFSPRFEYFGDPSGFTSKTPQLLHEFTMTGEYKFHPMVTGRCEFRRDSSDRDFFESGSSRLSRSQETFLIALLIDWKKDH
jgi:hypothetical protein